MGLIRVIIFFVFLLWAYISFAQTSYKDTDTAVFYKNFDSVINPASFNHELLEEILLFQVNKHREERFNLELLRSDSVLAKAALDQAEFMANYENPTTDGSGKTKTTGKRVRYYGGSTFADEVVLKMNVSRGKDYLTYRQVADEIVFKWFANKKAAEKLKDQRYIFGSTGAQLDAAGKKVYVSLVLGNYKSFNSGAERRGELENPYSTKKYGLKPYDVKACRKCDNFRNLEELQKHLVVNDGGIYFVFNDYRAFKNLMRKPKDGLAVDIIQRKQYDCNGANIVDNNLNNNGIMTKRLWSTQIYKNNLSTDRRNKIINVYLADLPEGIGNDYELNLVVIQDKYVCANLQKTYIAEGTVAYQDALQLLADTVTITETEYKPAATNTVLKFKIPFEAAKSEYKQEDIQPFLDALDEPDFIINELDITAYSSIEGSDEENRSLQSKRAETIVEAFRSMQQSAIKTKISKSYNIDEFRRDIGLSAYQNMVDMSVSEAQEYIRSNKLNKKLEPILANHRYAKIKLDVTYDIEGDKEQAYVVKMFNVAVQENNLPLALSIQKYIFKRVLAEEYTQEAVFKQKIPREPVYGGLILNKLWLSGLLMNKLWLQKYVTNGELEDGYCDTINDLYGMAPDNIYIYYNHLYCRILNETFVEDDSIDNMQETIDKLYESELSKETIDAINLKYQFRVIESLDTLEVPHPKLFESLDRIKKIVNLEESNWNNSLKLSYIFMEQKDYDFALKLLEPFIGEEVVFEELLFTYVSLCSFYPEKMSSEKFTIAMDRIRSDYPDRFCQLFDGSKFSMRVFENPLVKEMYCKSCKQ